MKITPFPEQQAVLDSEARFLTVACGIQSGKTMTGVIWLLGEILKHPKDDFLIGAPTYKILEQSTMKKFFEIFPMHTAIYRKQDSVLELINGGKIYIRSTEIPNNIEGMTVRAAWLDEAGLMKPQVWTNVQGRVAIKKGRVLMTTTPYNMGWLYRECVRQAQSQNPDYAIFNWASNSNPYFPAEEMERARLTMSGPDFERRYLGLFRQMEGLVYPDWEPQKMVENTPPIEDEVKEVVAGVDYGFTNPTSIQVVAITKDNTLHVIDEVYETRLVHSQIVDRCTELKEKWGVEMFYVDPVANILIDTMNSAGLPTMGGNNDVESGISKVRQLIKYNRIKIWFGCYNLLDEIENYHYQVSHFSTSDSQVEYQQKPDKTFDHAVDSLRYLVATHPLDIYALPGAETIERKERFWEHIEERLEKRKMNIARFGEDYSDSDIEAIESIWI